MIREVERLSASLPLKQDPLTRGEVKLILEAAREVKEKDPREVDMEKLDKALEIAWNWFEREGRILSASVVKGPTLHLYAGGHGRSEDCRNSY